MTNQDNIDNLLHKIWQPDFEIELYYPDNKITKNQRLLSNLAKLGYHLISNKNNKPFIRVKDTENGQNLVNDFFNVTWNKQINSNLEVHYFLDFIYDPKNEKSIYSCLYKNTSSPILFFDTLYFEHPISLLNIGSFNNTKQFILNKYEQYFDTSDNGLTLIQNIQLTTKKWEIKVI